MNKIYASEQRFWGENDSQTIQNAVDYAEKTGLGEVIIPRFNERTGKPLWDLPEAVLLPSDMTVILDGCHLRHADDTMDNLFRNRNMWTELGRTLAGEQHDIRIIGRGNCLIDGGKHNGIFEQHLRDNPDKYKSMLYQTPLTFSNVCRVEVRGIRFFETRYWAVCFHYCSWGMVSDLHIENSGLYENQDGVNLRIGCEYFTVQNITGWTGDDVVALTALPEGRSKPHIVDGKRPDIHDVTIQNIIASSHGCGLVRLLCENGAKEYNITIENLKDTTKSISGTSIIVGTADTHFADPPHQMGDFRDITVRNITTYAQRGISIAESVQNMLIENLTTYGQNECGIRFSKNFECNGLTIRNLVVGSDPKDLKCIFSMAPNPQRLLKDFRVERVRANEADYVFCGTQFAVEDFQYAPPRVAYFHPEAIKLASAYGRYHRCSYGVVIQDRPSDARFDSQGNRK